MKFYRYLIYKLYSWSNKGELDTPIGDVILTLSFSSLVLLMTFIIIISKLFHFSLDYFFSAANWTLYLSFIIVAILFYFLFYNKSKWDSYFEEFKHESRKEKRIGTIKVITLLVLNILFFFLTAIVAFWNNK